MFESAELGHSVSKETFEAEEPELRVQLLDAQFELREASQFAVLVLINGIDGAGKGETVNLLNYWMDPRHIETTAFEDATPAERERPFLWRYWQRLPPRGKIGVMFGNWYSDTLHKRVNKSLKRPEFETRVDEIKRFEAMLAREGVLLVKLWFHLSKKGQKKRLKTLADNPDTAWRITDRDWHLHDLYDRYRDVADQMLRRSSTGDAPWHIVDGSDHRYRSLFVGRTLVSALKRRLDEAREHWLPRQSAAAMPVSVDQRTLLNSLELMQPMSKSDYEKQLVAQQGRLAMLCRDERFAGRSLVAVFEGGDAAGKGGAIRRVTAALDARQVRVIPVAAPTEEERAQPYLWRFWRHVPRHGKVAIFDRSWYGRVLVERIEGFCSESDWMRAYDEINDFEAQLMSAGVVVVKFWLAVSPDEQLRRFKEREQEPHKRFKITDEDWRNRERAEDYDRAVCDMVDRTSTHAAPWVLVEADNKRHARIKVLRAICEQLETALG